jgi:valyl-tRNA synthetase
VATEIPNRFDFQQAAEEIYSNWEKAGCFNANPQSQQKAFHHCHSSYRLDITESVCILGHALDNTLPQVFKSAGTACAGFEALWIPGTDHAGIATQAVVERRLKEVEGKSRHELGRDGLINEFGNGKIDAKLVSCNN